MVDATTMHKQVLVLRLISKFRTLGMFHADLDPLKRAGAAVHPRPRPARPTASPRPTWTPSSTSARSRPGPARMRLRDIIEALKETYSRTFGAEYMYISDTPTKRFVQQRLEPIRSRPSYTPEQRRHILERLTAAETLERYLHTKYVGQKRFSGEGGDTLIPMLDQLIQQRGRGRRAGDRDRHGAPRPAQRARQHAGQDAGRSLLRIRGQGARRTCRRATSSTTRASRPTSSTPGGPVHLTLAFNPSHLEIVNPVVEGSVRARQHRRGDTRGRPGAAGADPRRRGDRRAGRHPGMPEHGADPRLLHRRHDPHRHQQPDRLHDVRSARHARHDLLHRHREDGRGADPPRQRRRSGGLPARDRDRDRLPAAVPQGRLHRPRLLPPPRPQRGRRADGHAAADVQEDQRSIRARASSTPTS